MAKSTRRDSTRRAGIKDSELNKLWCIARDYACSKGYVGHAEDFAQEYIMAKLRGRKATFGQYLIDYLRRTVADSKTKTYKLKLSSHMNYSEIEQHNEPSYEMKISSRRLNTLVGNLKGTEKAATILKYKWGFTNSEVAEVLGLTDCAIWMATNKVNKKLKKGMSKCAI